MSIETLPAVREHASIASAPDPAGALRFARETAGILKQALKGAGLVSKIQGREHVNAEGWTLLAAMTNHTPRVAWCRKVDPEIGDGWEARVEVLNADGMVVSAAEAMALRSEGAAWARQEYAIRSMAQTRATSKALKLRLGFIVALANYSTTPAEEMTIVSQAAPAPPATNLGEDRMQTLLDQLEEAGVEKPRSELDALLKKAPASALVRDSSWEKAQRLVREYLESFGGEVVEEPMS